MCKLRRYLWIGLVLNGFVALPARAGVIFEPYYSVGSTKSIKPQRASGTEKETISQREEKGLRAGLILASWLKLVLGVGESYQLTTSKESQIRDEYGELDFAADLGTTPVGVEQKKKELQRRASFTLFLIPVLAFLSCGPRLV